MTLPPESRGVRRAKRDRFVTAILVCGVQEVLSGALKRSEFST